MTLDEIYQLIQPDINPYFLKADRAILEPLLNQLIIEEETRKVSVQQESSQYAVYVRFYRFFSSVIKKKLHKISALDTKLKHFSQLFSRATSKREREQIILNFAKDLGAGENDLKKDQAAFGRWFGSDAIIDRCHRKIASLEKEMTLCLKYLALVATGALQQCKSIKQAQETWHHFDLEILLKRFFHYKGDKRVIIATLNCLHQTLKALPEELLKEALKPDTLDYCNDIARNTKQEIWLQLEALYLLELLSPRQMIEVLEYRLGEPSPGDDLFFRSSSIKVFGSIKDVGILNKLVHCVARDTSPYVRQTLAKSFIDLPQQFIEQLLPVFTLTDEIPEVRAAFILTIPQLLKNTDLLDTLLQTMVEVLNQEKDPFVLRVTFQQVVEGYKLLQSIDDIKAGVWLHLLNPLIKEKQSNASIPIRRWAAQSTEILWCESLPKAKELYTQFETIVSKTNKRTPIKLPDGMLKGYDDLMVGRVLSVLAQRNFSLELRRKHQSAELFLGPTFGFKTWRFLYEMFHPSAEKREAFSHTIGRIFKSQIRAPSGILAELAKTKVPGEPVVLEGEGGYRPYLPLMGEVLSSIHMSNKPVRIFTSEGITTLTAPPQLIQRIKALCVLNIQFAKYADLRNWQEIFQSKPSAYISKLRDLGFTINFESHEKPDESHDQPHDQTVTRFFNGVTLLPIVDQWEQLKEYFFSVFQNTLPELLVFSLIASVYFIASHLKINKKIRNTRNHFSLVIGGWGTRGKSGTERLKSAVFNALGYSFVCKTTGCEATLLYADRFGPTHEMLLFRPLDKASIWEQADVMFIAQKLDAELLLWECMGLTPNYVKILQRTWCRDDISTLTNAFPDHEDIQGPAGINIPETMSNFIPENGTFITTEEEMIPILRESARALNTNCISVDWLKVGLLTPDILARFPYSEHPANIALVLTLVNELGVEEAFALKEMADKVKPDIGVLKTFPVAQVNGRNLIFVNGMSANERYGCLSNWKRLGFDHQSMYKEPGNWITTLVNNREDRVARTQVFANILVNDLSVDRHYLIGSNLSGLVSYIDKAWEKFVNKITLWPQLDTVTDPKDILTSFARQYRVTYLQKYVIAQLKAMLKGINALEDIEPILVDLPDMEKLHHILQSTAYRAYSADIIALHQKNLNELQDYNTLLQKILSVKDGEHESIDKEFRALLSKWFKKKLYVIHDYYASGDQIINHIQRDTPPGFVNRIIGIQNIKGTGLNFVYQWQSWDFCYRACKKISQNSRLVVEQGMKELTSVQEFGLLSEHFVLRTLEEVKNKPVAQQEWFQADIAQVKSRLTLQLGKIKSTLQPEQKRNYLYKMIGIIELIFDMYTAVNRRRKSDQIYQDLISERISAERAVLEIQKLNQQQKGGWLFESIKARLPRGKQN